MQEKQAEFLKYIDHHVLTHEGSVDAWNLPFVHIDFLENFHYDCVVVFVIAVLLIGLAFWGRRSIGRIPRYLGSLLEVYILFIRDSLVYPNFGGAKLGRNFVPFFASLFLFILTANLLGLIPLFTTATGNISVTVALALIFMGVSFFSLFRYNGVAGLPKAFIPAGLPLPLKPIMFCLEIIGVGSRSFALAMRLFANMLGGHIVVYALLSLTAMLGLAASPSFVMGVALYLFEVFVAFLQAYVFTLLSSIFMGMIVHPDH